MNRLPDHRKALLGRTHGRTWNAADYDPIETYRTPTKVSDVVFAVVLGIIGAALLVHFLAR